MLKKAASISEDKTRDQLILDHIKQVEIIANRIRSKIPACVELGDLIGAGILGLLEAAEKFNSAQGISFGTYAEYRIRGSMLDSLRDLDWAPRNVRTKSKTLLKICESLEQRLGRTATEDEKCEALGIDINKYHQLVDRIARMKVNSLEEVLHSEDEKHPKPLEKLALSTSENPLDACERQEICCIMSECIKELPPKECLVVSLYYYDQLTMAEIGKVMSVNESRISQLHSHALQRMRTRLHSLFAAA
jgi:RNA polymerase sigma factor FliA